MGAEEADIDLSQYIACGIDTSALDSDIADVNYEYRRCKVLETAAENVLTDTLVNLITLRDSDNDIDDMTLDLAIDAVLDELFVISGESDQSAFEMQLESDLQNMGRITMLA